MKIPKGNFKKYDAGQLAEMEDLCTYTYEGMKELARVFGVEVATILYIFDYRDYRLKQRARSKRWRDKNLAKVTAKNRAYYKNNTEKCKEIARRYYYKDIDESRRKNRKNTKRHYWKNRIEILEASRLHRLELKRN